MTNNDYERNATGQDFVEDINTSNNNKFIVRFSNFPNFTQYKLNMNVLNLYLESITIPDITIPMLNSIYMHERQLHPATIGARELQTVNLTFQVDELKKNYFAFYSWMVYMRYGRTCGKKNLKQEELVRMNCIDKIETIFLDNNGEVTSKLVFGHCILNNLSSAEFTKQQSEISKFTVTFEVETVDLELAAEK
jgi:hypothetical protein